MKVTVKYFASLREALGRSEDRLELPEGVVDVTALRRHLAGLGGAHSALAAAPNLRAAVNQAMAGPGTALADGDEVAFFPPVTGG